MEPDKELDQPAHEVIGAAIEVHRILGTGFLESVYEEALCIELTLRGIPFERQYVVSLDYKKHPVGESRLDLLVAGKLIVELKAVGELAPIHFSQVIFYLVSVVKRLILSRLTAAGGYDHSSRWDFYYRH